MADLQELRFLAGRGAEERRQFLDAIEQIYGEELKAGNARARRLLAELIKSYVVQPGTPLSKEFFQRLLQLLPKADQQIFLDEMLKGAKAGSFNALDEVWTWWRTIRRRF